jgi:hypothetical protein
MGLGREIQLAHRCAPSQSMAKHPVGKGALPALPVLFDAPRSYKCCSLIKPPWISTCPHDQYKTPPLQLASFGLP